MKIVMFHDDSNLLGGAEQYRRDLTRLLRDMDHQVVTFACQDKHGADLDPDAQISRCVGDLEEMGRLRRVYFNPPLILEFRKFIGDTKPDLVHLHNNLLFTLSIISAIPLNVPVIQTIHDCRLVCPTGEAVSRSGEQCHTGRGFRCLTNGCIPWRNFFFRFPARRASEFLMKRRFERVLVPSMALRRIISNLGIESEFVPNFVDCGAFEVRPAPEGGPRLLFVGGLFRGKGVQVLLRAVKEISRELPDLAVDIVGAGPFEKELREMAGALALPCEVNFVGEKHPKELKEYYYRASAVVLPSTIMENCPLVLLEAMAAARPVIGSRIGGIPEIIADGENGLLFEPNDSDDLADKIKTVLTDRQLSNEMGLNGRRRAERDFSVQTHVDKLLKIYAQVSSKRNHLNN